MNKLNQMKDSVDDIKERVKVNDSWLKTMFYILIFVFCIWQLVDLFIIIPYNVSNRQGVGGCADNWIELPMGIFSSYITVPEKKCDEIDRDSSGDIAPDGNKCPSLGKWTQYAGDKGFLCASDADRIFKDAIDNNKVGGYNSTELLSYVIIPTMSVLGIIYGLIFTRLSYAEWIFWILITTVIYTGISSVSYTLNIDVLPPDQPSPLTYITDKLDFEPADELKYSFIARKSDGSECLMEGVMLGGGVKSQSQPPTYKGTDPNCSEKELPL